MLSFNRSEHTHTVITHQIKKKVKKNYRFRSKKITQIMSKLIEQNRTNLSNWLILILT